MQLTGPEKTEDLGANNLSLDSAVNNLEQNEKVVRKLRKEPSKAHLNYPGIEELLVKAKESIETKGKVIFDCADAQMHCPFAQYSLPNQNHTGTKIEQDWSARYKEYIDEAKANKASLSYTGSFAKELQRIGQHDYLEERSFHAHLGAPTSHFHSLLTKKLACNKVIGNFSFGYIESRANYHYRKWHNPNKPIDYFFSPEGICNIDALADVLKAQNLNPNEVVVLEVPTNAIKAFREMKLGDWQEVIPKKEKASFADGKLFHYGKDGKVISEFNIYEFIPSNLQSPIYKVKAGEYWVLLVPAYKSKQSSFSSKDGKITLNVRSFGHKNTLTPDDHIAPEADDPAAIKCSLGQAARVIYELSGGLDHIPEALLYSDGGSWSSIVTEKYSDGRHQGIYNLNQAIKNEWHTRDDVAIPWNYIGWDTLNASNEYLLEDPDLFVVSADGDESKLLKNKKVFIEAEQSWKKFSNELLQFVIKFVYEEYVILSSKKYHIDMKTCAENTARYLGRVALYDEKQESLDYIRELSELELPEELVKFLQVISYVHYAASGSGDFYSTKTHYLSIVRLHWLAKAHKHLKELCPASILKFEQHVNRILRQDSKSEFTTLENLYYSELNKLS